MDFTPFCCLRIGSTVTGGWGASSWSTRCCCVPFYFLPWAWWDWGPRVTRAVPPFPAYLGFLWMLLLVAYGQRDPSTYHFNRHLERSFTQGFSAVLGFQEFFTWANTTLMSNLYSHYPGTLPSPRMCVSPLVHIPKNRHGSLSPSAL